MDVKCIVPFQPMQAAGIGPHPPGERSELPGTEDSQMARKLQLGALILGMLFVGVSRFVATASASGQSITSPMSEGGMPIPTIRR